MGAKIVVDGSLSLEYDQNRVIIRTWDIRDKTTGQITLDGRQICQVIDGLAALRRFADPGS